MFKDFFAGIRDFVGGRSGAYEKELSKARKIAREEMVKKAEKLGVNAIIGVDYDYESIVLSEGGGMPRFRNHIQKVNIRLIKPKSRP